MKSFPSTANESERMFGKNKLDVYSSKFDIERLKTGALTLNQNPMVIKEMLKEENINIANYSDHTPMYKVEFAERTSNDNNSVSGNDIVYYENPLMLPAEIIALAKDYDWVYSSVVNHVASAGQKKGEDKLYIDITETTVAPSMFNPMYGVNVFGITRNTPLINEARDSNEYYYPQIADCSIRTLCALSKTANNELGQARYKYADFMYCKDLGKVSNNHLITLRKFSHPVGDHIFELTTPKYVDDTQSYKVEGDIGRLITWFGTEDNNLEDICKYSYNATWVEKEAAIQEENSNADDESTGLIGMFSNTANSLYNEGVNQGTVGTHSIWGYLGSKYLHWKDTAIAKNNKLLSNYDNNKVYTPKNTIQSTHLYEGKLVFNQEFTLNFCYKLRAYDNINPRSALLDLLGNIFEVTYRRGKFWGGDRKIIGPPQDTAPFDKVNAFIDNSFDKMGGVFASIFNGGLNMDNIYGALGQMQDGMKNLANKISNFDFNEAASKLKETVTNFANNAHFTEALKGMVKNKLGRPTLYAWHSLLTGDPVGLWHVTIGNPRNPILVMGNLILVNSTVQHSGPLGIDDFPTDLKVSITLKHARPRDVTEISRMYTKGLQSIYYSFAHHDQSEFFGASTNIEALSGKDASQKIDASYKKDLEKANQNTDVEHYSKSLSNPFLDTNENIKIMRTNNWSDTMFTIEMEEAA